MASGPQPAVEGQSSGTTQPTPPPVAPAGDGGVARNGSSGPDGSDGSDVVGEPGGSGAPKGSGGSGGGRWPTGRCTPCSAAAPVAGHPLLWLPATPGPPCRGAPPGAAVPAVAPDIRRSAPAGPATLPVGTAVAPGLRVGRGAGSTRRQTGPRVVTGRRTRRVVRKIDVWTVLKMSILFYLCVFLVFMVAGVVLWNIADAFNVIKSVEKFIRSIFDLQKFTFRPSAVLQSAVLGGGVLVLLATGANVLAALLYNLISDVVGGVQFIVLEDTGPPE